MLNRIKNAISKSDYLRNILFQAFGNSFGQLIGILGIPILTRLYSPEGFATQSLFVQLATFITGFVTFRFEYLFQLTKNEDEQNDLLAFVIKFGLIFTALITFFIFVFERQLADIKLIKSLGLYFYICPFFAYVLSLAIALQANAQRNGNFKTSGLSEIVGKASYVIIGVVLSQALHTTGLLLTNIASSISKIIYLKPKHLLTKNKKTGIIRKLSKESTSLFVSHIFYTVTSASPIFFVSYKYGNYDLGNFSLVLATIFLPSGVLGLAIGQAYYKKSAETHREKKSIADLWSTTLSKLIMIGAPIYLILALTSMYIYPIVFGEDWAVAGQIAIPFALAAFFQFISTPLDRTSIVVNVTKYLPIWHFFRAWTTILVFYVSIKENLSIIDFCTVLSIQISILYLIDIIFGYIFSHKKLASVC